MGGPQVIFSFNKSNWNYSDKIKPIRCRNSHGHFSSQDSKAFPTAPASINIPSVVFTTHIGNLPSLTGYASICRRYPYPVLKRQPDLVDIGRVQRALKQEGVPIKNGDSELRQFAGFGAPLGIVKHTLLPLAVNTLRTPDLRPSAPCPLEPQYLFLI